MIHLTRLNDRPLVVNADLIKLIENAPDTVITLVNGEKLLVKETAEEIIHKVMEFHRGSGRRVNLESAATDATHEPQEHPESGSR